MYTGLTLTVAANMTSLDEKGGNLTVPPFLSILFGEAAPARPWSLMQTAVGAMDSAPTPDERSD